MFVVLSFLTLVFYGLWVASGVVAEKAGRVMELLISAATAPQLVIGKIVGIGLAGLTQVSLVLDPGALGDVRPGRIGDARARAGRERRHLARRAVARAAGRVPRLLRARVRALRGAVRGRGLAPVARGGPPDVALPLSIPAIMGYFPAVLALSGGTSAFIRFASYVPLWSPFVMLAAARDRPRGAMGARAVAGAADRDGAARALLAIRVYRAGVLLYGQPPTIRRSCGRSAGPSLPRLLRPGSPPRFPARFPALNGERSFQRFRRDLETRSRQVERQQSESAATG